MAQQTINVGAAPNDGTGTPLRTAFQYTNSNFSELYTAVGPSGNNIVVPGNATITGDLTVDTSTLKVDSANNRVIVGHTSGSSAFQVTNAGAAGLEIQPTGFSSAPLILSYNRSGSAYTQLTLDGSTIVHALNGSTAMTLNSTGLGVGTSPANDKILSLGSIGILLPVSNVSDFNFRNSGGVAIQRLRYTDATGGLTIGSATATAYPVELGGSTSIRAVTIDSSLNVGIGVVPSAWLTAVKSIDIQSGGLSVYSGGITHNAYYDNTDSRWEYKGTGAATFYNPQNGVHQWFVAASGTANNPITTFATAAMTLDASGNLLVGTTSLISGTADGSINIAGANSQQIVIRNTGATAGQFWRQAVDSGNTFYVLNNASTGVSITSGATSWSAVSDERLKDIIEPISNAIAKVGSLRSVIGKYKNDETNTRRSFLIAQDVLSVLPEAVDSSKSNELGLRYSEVIPLLVAAIKELTAEVNALKNA